MFYDTNNLTHRAILLTFLSYFVLFYFLVQHCGPGTEVHPIPFYLFIYFSFETGSYQVAKVPGLNLNPQSSCLSLPKYHDTKINSILKNKVYV